MSPQPNEALRLQQFMVDIKAARERLLQHPIYEAVNSPQRLRVFMQSHVFAVWDFMSLLKALQRRLTCVELPWLPPSDSELARFVNEIVLGEESDEDGEGGHCSHFQLYVRAMGDCGAKTDCMLRFGSLLQQGRSVQSAIAAIGVSSHVIEFVRSTFSFIERGRLSEIAAAFTFGREDVIPDMFQRFVEQLSAESPQEFSKFRFYLERHIHLDADDHGPKAVRMVARLCGNDSGEWEHARQAALRAIAARERFWDGLLKDIKATA